MKNLFNIKYIKKILSAQGVEPNINFLTKINIRPYMKAIIVYYYKIIFTEKKIQAFEISFPV